MLEKAIGLNDTNFIDELADATGIIFCHKKLCPNCKAMKIVVEKFVSGKENIKILQVDSEDSPETMKHLGVEKVPALLIIKKGIVVAQKVGLMNVQALSSIYNSAQ